jgi:hypothetical protein
MIAATTHRTRAALALALSLSLCLCGLLGGVAMAAEGKAIVYTHESATEFAKQLTAREVESVIVNKRLRTLRATLSDGRHVSASYPKHERAATVARLKAHGAAVTILTKKQAAKEVKKSKHHTRIRYIIGGAVILVIVVAAAVLLVNRRRRRD